MTECPSCSGTGKVACVHCYHGWVQTQTGTISNFEAIQTVCLICRGTRVAHCEFCNGTGRIDNLSAPKGPPCKHCRGTGYYFKCRQCDGKGYLAAGEHFEACGSCYGKGGDQCLFCAGTGVAL